MNEEHILFAMVEHDGVLRSFADLICLLLLAEPHEA